MPLINLIQEQRTATLRAERKGRFALAALGTSFVLGVGVYGVLAFQTDNALAEESRLRAERQKLEPLQMQAEANRRELQDLRPRLSQLESAQADTGRWHRVLEHLVGQTPKSTWLTSLRSLQTDTEKPVEVTLAGMSPSQGPIGELMLRTQAQRDLEEVTLKFTQERTGQYGKFIEFELNAALKGTAEERPKTEEEKKS